MNAPENPAGIMRTAADLMRKRAEAATPGPWERPLDVRSKAIVIAALPDGEEPRSWDGGVIPAEFASHSGPTGRYAGQRERCAIVSAPSNNITGFDRKRSGRDLEHIASWHPLVALAVAEWLEWTGERAAAEFYKDDLGCSDPDVCVCNGQHVEVWFCNRCAEQVGVDCTCWDRAIAVARAYLGEAS